MTKNSRPMTTDIMLNEALKSLSFSFDHTNSDGVETSVWIAPNGVVYWYIEGFVSTQEDVDQILKGKTSAKKK